MNVNPFKRLASLAGEPGCTAENGIGRIFKIGGWQNDRGIFSTQLQKGRDKVMCRLYCHFTTGFNTAGKTNCIDLINQRDSGSGTTC